MKSPFKKLRMHFIRRTGREARHWLRPSLTSCFLLWNPLVAAAVTFVLGGGSVFVQRWLIALLISDVCMLQCVVGVRVILWAEAAFCRWRRRPVPVYSIRRVILLSIPLGLLSMPLGFAAAGAAAPLFGVHFRQADFSSYRLGIGIGALIAALFFSQRSRVELENEHLKAKLAALTAEMNPHLLFNALNTVASLIHQDPDRAEEVVVQLAELYRGVLRSSGSSTHSLQDEVRLCEAYLQVERARFGDRLEIAIEVDESARSIEVPVLVLQPFVENAIKHGFSQRARGGKVMLLVRRDHDRLDASVEDDGVGFGNSKEAGASKAIANCKARLALAYGDRARLSIGPRDGGGTRVTVSLPVTA
jgi:sensor histidine kinase YesM